MPRSWRLLVLSCAVVIAACSTPRTIAPPTGSAIARAPLGLIPAPASVQFRDAGFRVDASVRVIAGAAAANEAGHFIGLLEREHGLHLALAPDAPTDAAVIEFALRPAAASPDNDEAYAIDVQPRRIVVSATRPHGLFNGAMSLWQLLSKDARGRLVVRGVRIDDAPRFAWRGLMLDSARHFETVDEIKRLLDAMAQHKLNVFHWHLTDDQGWRLEIRKYPKLTSIGGCRIPLGDAGRDPTTGQAAPLCAYYTQEQVRDVVRHAAERHIEVVPEIDVPGHAQAAIAAYPQLGVLDHAPRVSSEWGVHQYLFNVEPGTLEFLTDVFEEVVELFPGRYVHVGGDEAVKDQWKNSPRVQQRMRELGIADETALQAWMVARIEVQLRAHGRRLIGWDEILDGDLPAAATVMSWRGTDGGIDAVRRGHDVVMSPNETLYFDYLQSDSPSEVPGRPTLSTLHEVYSYEPVPAALGADEAKHVLGAQANLWTEHLRTPSRVQRALFPRIAALAEVAWSPRERSDWSAFVARLPAQFERYRALGIDASTTAFDVLITARPRADGKTVEVSMANALEGSVIRYTVDGREPDAASPRYTAPLQLGWPVTLRANTFIDGAVIGPVSSRRIDLDSLRSRRNHELASCTKGLPLRLEDDGPYAGERAIFTADIFNPCWLFEDAPLDGVRAVHVRAAQLPYNFQLYKDEAHRRSRPVTAAHGEFELRAGCDGELLGSVVLPAMPAADGFIDLDLALPPLSGLQTLCLRFTGDTRPTYWVVDSVRLLPRSP